MTNEIFIPLDVSKTLQGLPREEGAKLISAIDSLEADGPKNAVRLPTERVPDDTTSGLFQIRSGEWLIAFQYRPENESIIISSLIQDAKSEREHVESQDMSDSWRAFLQRVGAAFLRIVALVMFGGAHWLLERFTTILTQWTGLPSAGIVVNDTSFVVFALIYVYLLWDMLRLFLPVWRPKGPANQRSSR